MGAEFDRHIRKLQWKQGEHIFVSGSTGSGKTTLIRNILDKRKHVIAFGVKVRDSTLTQDYAGWSVVNSMRDIEPWMDRVLLWPRPPKRNLMGKRLNVSGADLLAFQRKEMQLAFNTLLTSQGWCLFIDELNYLCKFFDVQREIESMHYIGRSSGLSIVSAAQRPAYVPLAVLSNSSHAYVGRTRLQSDLKRLADFGADLDAKKLAEQIRNLPSRHDFLYTPTQGEGESMVVNTRM